MTGVIDRSSAIGKAPAAERHVPLIVVGAGTAGLAAAIAAAHAGVETMLVDENPLPGDLIALDVPLHFGGRANAAVLNPGRMIERILDHNRALAEAFDLGIDVQLGVSVWAAYVNGQTVHSLDRPLLGLTDGTRSWMVSFERLIVAAGARDLAMAFRGWEKPGVMGLQAASSLSSRYGAFDGRRLLILGSGAPALAFAETAIAAGLEIAGIVEVDAEPRDQAALARLQAAADIPFYASHAIREARGRAEVEGAELVALDGEGQPVPGGETIVPCDTIVTALGSIPNIELLNVLGCQVEFCSSRGGYVPILAADGETSLPGIYAIGDCAGAYDRKSLDAAWAESEGRQAAAAVLQSFGGSAPDKAIPYLARPSEIGGEEIHGYWQRWSRAEIAASGWNVHICQCEEVTRAELAELRPPRYLGWNSAGHNRRRVVDVSPVNQDQVKRLTRAGMGPCQGRRCREQIQLLLADLAQVPAGEIPLASYRAPVRPLPLGVFAAFEESAAVRDNWVAWFNIPSQWTPHWEIDEAALIDLPVFAATPSDK
jgi:thioredoxin reductase